MVKLIIQKRKTTHTNTPKKIINTQQRHQVWEQQKVQSFDKSSGLIP
jgi:hypothetical protein